MLSHYTSLHCDSLTCHHITGLPKEVRKRFAHGKESLYETAASVLGDEAHVPGGAWDRFLKWSGVRDRSLLEKAADEYSEVRSYWSGSDGS